MTRGGEGYLDLAARSTPAECVSRSFFSEHGKFENAKLTSTIVEEFNHRRDPHRDRPFVRERRSNGGGRR